MAKKPTPVFPSLSALLKNPVHFLAFGLGSGLIRPAPGTWGTLMGLLLILPFLPWLHSPVAIAGLLIASFVVGVYLCGKTAEDLHCHDHSGIVWDEFVGVWIVLLTAPPALYLSWGKWGVYLAVFFLFRLFDIFKPWPIRKLDEHAPGGFGIMIDDVLAGVYGAAVLWGIAFVIA